MRHAFLFVLSSTFIACGGSIASEETTDAAPPPEIDTGWVPAPPPLLRYQSFTATFETVEQRWNRPPPATPEESLAPSMGWQARFDVAEGIDGKLYCVVSPAFGEPMLFLGEKGPAGTERRLTATRGDFASTLEIRGPRVTDGYLTIVMVLDAAGRPTSAKAIGDTYFEDPTIDFRAKTEATISFVPDRVVPRWRARALTSVAPIALPWDARVLEASEPYEELLVSPPLVPESASVRVTNLTSNAWGSRPRDRGFTIVSSSWDQVASLRALHRTAIGDLAGNLLAADSSHLPFEGGALTVPPPKSIAIAWSGPRDTRALRWGLAAIGTNCRASGRSCLQIGPFPQGGCLEGSKGGFAARLFGSGVVHAYVRVTARAKVASPITKPEPRVRMTIDVPSGAPSGGTDGSALVFGKPVDGLYDTGWVKVIGFAKTGEKETGIAFTAGGIGEPRPIKCSYDWDVTVMVDEVFVDASD